MTLFAASIALIVLLIASYGTRRLWLGCLSVALTGAALVGIVFLAMLASPGQSRAGLAWLAGTLPLDDTAAQSLASAIENAQIAPAETKLAATQPATPVRRSAAANEPESESRRAPQQAATGPSLFGPRTPPKIPPKVDPNSPVAWFIDDPDAPVTSPLEEGLSIGGVNVSDQDLKQVEGTLKPDGSWREIPLTLKVEGRAAKAGAIIKAGERFSLVADSADAVRVPQRGAILTFRYVYEGQRKAAILYLNAATLSRFASRE